MLKLPIYMDNHATTPLDPRVLDAMLPYLTARFGNAASRTHTFGWEAEAGVERARGQVAELIGALPLEIVFTSGATEANNLALKSVAEARKREGRHIITVVTEHKATLDTCHWLESQGFRVSYITPPPDGVVTAEHVRASLRPDTILVSVMLANNEVGTINDVEAIGELCRRSNIVLHTDAAQAAGKVHFDVRSSQVDLVSLSAHKVYGPKGIGALYVRRDLGLELDPQMHGGGHERGLRSGTLNVPGIVGFGKACEIAEDTLAEEGHTLRKLRDLLHDTFFRDITGYRVNGDYENRLPGNLNAQFPGVDGESLVDILSRVVAVSLGSACTSASVTPSYVLKALGLTDDQAQSSVRFGLGRFNTEQEVLHVAKHVVESVKKLRGLNPALPG